VLVDPITPTLTAPGTRRLELKYDEPLSHFGFKFNLRRYSEGDAVQSPLQLMTMSVPATGRGLQSFRVQLNLSSSVHRRTQLNPGICPGVAQVEL